MPHAISHERTNIDLPSTTDVTNIICTEMRKPRLIGNQRQPIKAPCNSNPPRQAAMKLRRSHWNKTVLPPSEKKEVQAATNILEKGIRNADVYGRFPSSEVTQPGPGES